MSISIGLDFGSMGYRAAYVLDREIVPVPMPPDEAAWHGLVFADSDPRSLPLGLTFSSLKYQLGTGKRFNWGGRALVAEEAVRDIFANLKRAVQIYAGEEIGRTVIAVPAQYPALRRAILRELAEASGFGKVDLINDCTAAALGHTYGLEENPRTLLHYSMGFIGFEVSLVRFAHQRLRELVHEGALVPSGRDFDLLAMASAIESLSRQGYPLPTKVFTSQWFDLRFLISDMKESLSAVEEGILDLPPHLTGNNTVRLRFPRRDFESGISRHIDATLESVQQALEEAGMTPDDIDEVVLVGGSTRMNIIQRRLESVFGEKLVQPRDDLIARGAAVQASRLGEPTVEGTEVETLYVEPTLVPKGQASPNDDGRGALSSPLEPSLEPLLAYARQLIASGQNGAAAEFVEKLESCSRDLRERLSAV